MIFLKIDWSATVYLWIPNSETKKCFQEIDMNYSCHSQTLWLIRLWWVIVAIKMSCYLSICYLEAKKRFCLSGTQTFMLVKDFSAQNFFIPHPCLMNAAMNTAQSMSYSLKKNPLKHHQPCVVSLMSLGQKGHELFCYFKARLFQIGAFKFISSCFKDVPAS